MSLPEWAASLHRRIVQAQKERRTASSLLFEQIRIKPPSVFSLGVDVPVRHIARYGPFESIGPQTRRMAVKGHFFVRTESVAGKSRHGIGKKSERSRGITFTLGMGNMRCDEVWHGCYTSPLKFRAGVEPGAGMRGRIFFITLPPAFPPIHKKVRQAVGREKIVRLGGGGQKKIIIKINVVLR